MIRVFMGLDLKEVKWEDGDEILDKQGGYR